MPNTFTQIYIQVVFAVEWRQSLIRPEHKEEIHKYITGILRNKRQKLIEINSMPDHVHMLIGMEPDIAVSDLVREIKKSSTNFINTKHLVRGKFNWQEGFGAFSYSRSSLDSVIRYIRNQEAHHQRTSFKNEYLAMLRKFDIAFDDRYLFDFPDADG
jgi:REP-associated tyrosine transposase